MYTYIFHHEMNKIVEWMQTNEDYVNCYIHTQIMKSMIYVSMMPVDQEIDTDCYRTISEHQQGKV